MIDSGRYMICGDGHSFRLFDRERQQLVSGVVFPTREQAEGLVAQIQKPYVATTTERELDYISGIAFEGGER